MQRKRRIGLAKSIREKRLPSACKYAMDMASTVSPRSLRVIKRQVYEAC